MASGAPEFTPVRPGGELPVAELAAFLRDRLPGADKPLELFQFTGGHANLTYVLRFSNHEYVLRRPPKGKIAPGAHDMAREYTVLSALAPVFPLAPRAYLQIDDESILGFRFIVMERRVGQVIRADFPSGTEPDPALCARIGEMVPSILAQLHVVDAQAVGLGELGNPDNYLVRQMEGWVRRYLVAAPRAQLDLDAGFATIIDWLQAGIPSSGSAAILHNDFKLDNVLLSKHDLAQPVAILDWDMCTRGDPLAELGYLLNYWAEAGDDPEWIAAASMPTWRKGFPSRREMVDIYARETGRTISGIHWYHVFAVFKIAVILLQIFARYRSGETSDPRFGTFDRRVAGLVRKGNALIRRGDDG